MSTTIEAGAIPYNDTGTVDKSWDAAANLKRLGDNPGRAKLRAMHAWVDGSGDQEAKASYKLPHHEVDSSGNVGAANLAGVRNALSRLPQSNIPQGDHSAVQSHLNRHLNKGKGGALDDDDSEVTARAPAAWLAEMEAHVWAMHPQVLGTLVMLARAGTPLDVALEQAAPEAARRGRPPSIKGSIAKVDLKGVLMPGGGTLFGLLFGFANPLDTFRAGFAEAMADPNIGHVVIDIDSPGGVTDLIPETAAEIRDIRAKSGKGVTAFVNTMAASAAYWLASQADEVVVTPSGMTGSIGVYATHRDVSKLQDELGIKTTLIKAGKYKVEGNPFEPLSDEALAHIQSDVDYFYDLFTADVARGRGVEQQAVIDGYGEGRVLPAKDAKRAGLADRIETLGETVARLSQRAKGSALNPAAEALDAGADDDTVTAEEEDSGADTQTERALLMARLEGHSILQDHAWDKMQPAS